MQSKNYVMRFIEVKKYSRALDVILDKCRIGFLKRVTARQSESPHWPVRVFSEAAKALNSEVLLQVGLQDP